MSDEGPDLGGPVAIRAIDLEACQSGLNDLSGYTSALVVIRHGSAVVGQARLPVVDGCISPASLSSCLPAIAWPVWLQLVTAPESPRYPLPTASVIVCTRDRPADLAGCLPRLAQFAAQGHDVIVVDNCPSNDATARLAARYPAIRYVLEPRPGLDVARNCGLLAARGDIVAFTDDDAEPDPGWLRALLRDFGDPLVAVVTGMTLPLELETPAQQWFERTDGFGRGFVRRQFDADNTNILATGPIGAGVNMAIRRSALERIGLFDEALDGGTPSRSGGDQEFFYRALARGYRIVYEPAALVWHRHRREWSALRRTIHGYGVGVFAWWTRCLIVEKELTLLKMAPRWFLQHHIRNLVRALLRRPGCAPLDLALAEFLGGLAGPFSYLRSRRASSRPGPGASRIQESRPGDLCSQTAGQGLEAA